MASLAIQPKPVRANLAPDAPMHSQLRSLVVSSELETRKPLLRALESLKVDVVVCGRRLQAEDALSRTSFDVVFCDECLPDGSYADLIHGGHWDKTPRLIVTTTHGDWDLYFQALAKGAFDVIRCPYYATDIEMALIRVLRDGRTADYAIV